MSVIFQVLATAIISYVCMTLGIMYAWPSSTLLLFMSPNTTLNRVMTETEVSLLGSLPSIGGIIAFALSGYLMDTLGRKWSCMMFYVAQLGSWVIIITCTTVEAILLAMFLFGISSCIFLVVPIYISEFCQASIRGSMTSSSQIFFVIGILVSYLMGGLLEYNTMNYVGLALTILGLVLFSTMKESPLYLMKIGREQEAARSISFFRSVKVDSKEVEQELENFKRILNPDIDDTPAEEKKLNIEDQRSAPKKLSQWQFLKKSRSTQRGLFLCIMLFISSIFQGLIVVQVYAGPLFAKAMPFMSPTVACVILAIISVISGLFGAFFVDRFGRRPLMMYASLATGACCVVLGSQIQLNWGPNWLTAVFMYLYCVTFSLGPGTVPYVVSAEVFLPEIKALSTMMSMESWIICNFVVLFIFNPLVNRLGLGVVFYIFAIFCFLSTLFCFFFLPETKGLPVDVIQKKLLRVRE